MVRLAMAGWERLGKQEIELLSRDTDGVVRTILVRTHLNKLTPEQCRRLACDEIEQVGDALAFRYHLPKDVLLRLARDPSQKVQMQVLRRQGLRNKLPIDVIEIFQLDDRKVRPE